MATFILVTNASKKDNDIVLDRILYIHYLLHFCKDKKNKVQAFINFGDKVNVMISEYVLKLGLKIC